MVEDERLVRALMLGQPSFMKRAIAVEKAEEVLIERVLTERQERLRALVSLAREIEVLKDQQKDLPDEINSFLTELQGHPNFDSYPQPQNPRSLQKLQKLLNERLQTFNSRWETYINSVSLEKIHEAQTKYNKYYAFERELALPNLPPLKFEPIELFKREELYERFPVFVL